MRRSPSTARAPVASERASFQTFEDGGDRFQGAFPWGRTGERQHPAEALSSPVERFAVMSEHGSSIVQIAWKRAKSGEET